MPGDAIELMVDGREIVLGEALRGNGPLAQRDGGVNYGGSSARENIGEWVRGSANVGTDNETESRRLHARA